VPGAVNIGLDGQFASWAGTLLASSEIVLIAEPGKVEEAVMRLARVGMENVAGFLDGGMEAWNDATATLPQVEVGDLREQLRELRVLDVRRPGEYQGGHVPGAVNVTLAELPERLGEVDRAAPLAVICQSGYRSSVAASLMQRQAFGDLRNVAGGTTAWIAAGYEVL
jgi:hydroxyacylglutathione hydrolase